LAKPEWNKRPEPLAEVLNDIALVHMTSDELRAAEEYYKVSDQIVAQKISPKSDGFEQHGRNQNGLGLISLHRYYDARNDCDLKDARKHFEEADRVFKENTGYHPRGYVLTNLAVIDYLEGNYPAATDQLKLTAQIWKNELGALSPDLQLTYKHLSQVLALVDRPIEASNLRNEADLIEYDRNHRGFDIILERPEAIYSDANGKDEWTLATERLHR
jgi:hypothetical protein